jgi:hypothetical protein
MSDREVPITCELLVLGALFFGWYQRLVVEKPCVIAFREG